MAFFASLSLFASVFYLFCLLFIVDAKCWKYRSFFYDNVVSPEWFFLQSYKKVTENSTKIKSNTQLSSFLSLFGVMYILLIYLRNLFGYSFLQRA